MTNSSSNPPKPKRGAPYGNKNRQRHGRYARSPLPAPTSPSEPTAASAPESPSPDEAPSPDRRLTLTEEISYLRAYMLRTALIGAATFELGLTKDVLRALSLAATSLTRLVQTENWLTQTTGAQVQIDDLPRAFLSLQQVSEQVLESLPRRAAPRPPLDPQEDDDSASDQEDDVSTSDLLHKLARDLGIDIDDDLASALDFPTPAPKLPADSPDHAPDPLSRLDRLTRN